MSKHSKITSSRKSNLGQPQKARSSFGAKGLIFQSSYRKKGSKDESDWSGWRDHDSLESTRSILRLTEDPHHEWEYRLRVVTVYDSQSVVAQNLTRQLKAHDALMHKVAQMQIEADKAQGNRLFIEYNQGDNRLGCKCDPVALGWIGRNLFPALHHWQNGCKKPYFKNTDPATGQPT